MFVELQDDEWVLGNFCGIYWKKRLSVFYSPKIVRFCITTYKFVFEDASTNRITLEVKKIAAIKRCWVGSLISLLPMGIKVTLQDGSAYKFTVLARGEKLEIMQNAREAWQARKPPRHFYN
jgi:hypothetical protein